MDSFQSIIDSVNRVELSGCEGIRCGDTLYYVLQGRGTPNPIKEWLSGMRSIIRVLFYDDIDIVLKAGGKNLFLFSNSYKERKDHYANFERIVALAENSVLAKPGMKRWNHHKGFLKLVRTWRKQLAGVIENRAIRMTVLATILKAYADYSYISGYFETNNIMINNVITFCDVHSIDSFVTQAYNQRGVNTVTLQHGVFTSGVNSWALSGSQSKYFFCSNRFTYDEARLLGVKNEMIIAGMYSYVGKEDSNRKEIEGVDTIGVFLDGEVYREDNIKTLSHMIEYNKKYGKSIKVKFHPASDMSTYKKYIEMFDEVESIGKEKNVIDFCKEVDVVVARNSTTLIEALQFGIPSFIIHDDSQEADVFKNVDILKFSSAEELHTLIDNHSIEDLKEQLRSGRAYFCLEENITENYKKIFERIGIV